MLGNWFLDEDGEDYTFDETSSLYLRNKSRITRSLLEECQ